MLPCCDWLKRSVHGGRWRQEIEWLTDELRSTARALETALAALRPTAQRFSLALGAAAPEPQSRGLGATYCAELRDNAAERTASVLSSVLAAWPTDGTMPSLQVRSTLFSAVALLLLMQTWAIVPLSPAECRAELVAALKRHTALCDANQSKMSDVMAMAQQLQNIACGWSFETVNTVFQARLGDPNPFRQPKV